VRDVLPSSGFAFQRCRCRRRNTTPEGGLSILSASLVLVFGLRPVAHQARSEYQWEEVVLFSRLIMANGRINFGPAGRGAGTRAGGALTQNLLSFRHKSTAKIDSSVLKIQYSTHTPSYWDLRSELKHGFGQAGEGEEEGQEGQER
jgi:hypothetical protein